MEEKTLWDEGDCMTRFANVGSEESAMNIVNYNTSMWRRFMHDAMACPNYIADLNT